MKLFGWVANKFKVCGITVFKIKETENELAVSLFNIKFIRYKTDRLQELVEIANINKIFDTSFIDALIAKKTPAGSRPSKDPASNKVAVLASVLYDMGGHTECLKNLLAFLPDDYEKRVFLTACNKTAAEAPVKTAEMKKHASFAGVNAYQQEKPVDFKKQLEELYRQVVDFAPKNLFVFIHPDDVLAVALLAKIKKSTDMRVFYFNHATHLPAFGFSFADVVLEEVASTAYITQKFRKNRKVKIYGLPCEREADIPVYTETEIAAERKRLGVPDGFLCTMSGASAYKFFDADGSRYFEMVKKLLERNERLVHIVVTELNEERKNVVNGLFAGSTAENRLKIVPFAADFQKLFKCADVFIDSFPMSSALTQINCLALKVPTVVKINAADTALSFHEYFPADYKYKFETPDAMLAGIQKLLDDKAERARVADENYGHYLRTFEGDVIARKTVDLMNADLQTVYEPDIPDKGYRFPNIAEAAYD